MSFRFTKTIPLSTPFPFSQDGTGETVFTINGQTSAVFDLTNIPYQQNGYDLYKIYFDYGDGNTQYVDSSFRQVSGVEVFLPPSKIPHLYSLSDISNTLIEGEVVLFYKNGFKHTETLSIYSTPYNLIDFNNVVTDCNTFFTSNSAETLFNFINNEDGVFCLSLKNQSIQNLSIFIPTLVTTLSGIELTTTLQTPLYPSWALSATQDVFDQFTIFATVPVQYIQLGSNVISEIIFI